VFRQAQSVCVRHSLPGHWEPVPGHSHALGMRYNGLRVHASFAHKRLSERCPGEPGASMIDCKRRISPGPQCSGRVFR
jgi:hypothetical protein